MINDRPLSAAPDNTKFWVCLNHFHYQDDLAFPADGCDYSDWPSCLYMDGLLRQLIFMAEPPGSRSDIDLDFCHGVVAVRKCETHGLCCDALKDEMLHRKKYTQEVLGLNRGLTKRQLKQLPTSILNGGTIEGWKHSMVKDSGILFDRMQLPKAYHAHCTAMMKEVRTLRDRELGVAPWQAMSEVLY